MRTEIARADRIDIQVAGARQADFAHHRYGNIDPWALAPTPMPASKPAARLAPDMELATAIFDLQPVECFVGADGMNRRPLAGMDIDGERRAVGDAIEAATGRKIALGGMGGACADQGDGCGQGNQTGHEVSPCW